MSLQFAGDSKFAPATHLDGPFWLREDSFSWTWGFIAARLGISAEEWHSRFGNDAQPSIDPRLEIALSCSGIPLFLCGHAGVVVWNGNEFCGCDLVRPGRDTFHGESQPDRHSGNAARAGSASVWRSAHRSRGPALSGNNRGCHARRDCPGDGRAGVRRAAGAVGTVLDGSAAGRGICNLLVNHQRADPGTRAAGKIDHGKRHRADRRARRNGGSGGAGGIHLRARGACRNSWH